MSDQLSEAWTELKGIWEDSIQYWDDSNRVEFEQKYWNRIEEIATNYLQALSELRHAIEAS